MKAVFVALAAASVTAISACGGGGGPASVATANVIPAAAAIRPASARIPDFAFAGYRMGAQPIPQVKTVTRASDFGAKGDGVTDDTRALRSAIDATVDGALELGAGRFVVGDALVIPRGRVVLRGQGPGKTVLVIPRSLTQVHPAGDALAKRFYGFVVARGAIEGKQLATIGAPASRGARELVVEAPFEARAGDLVRVRMGNADALARMLLGGELEPGTQTPKDYEHYVDWAAPVAGVVGRTLRLTRGLRLDVRPEWQAKVLAFQPTVEDVGVEDLSFEFPGTARPQMQDEGFNAIHFVNVANSWVRNVSFPTPTPTPTTASSSKAAGSVRSNAWCSPLCLLRSSKRRDGRGVARLESSALHAASCL